MEDTTYILPRTAWERLFKTLPDKVKLQQLSQYENMLTKRKEALKQQQNPQKPPPPAL